MQLTYDPHPKLTLVPPPEIVNKGWGYEKILFNDNELCCKILHFNKGASFSSHAHRLKLEYFTILSKGKLLVEGINTEDASKYYIELNPGDVLKVPRLAFHKITALEETDLLEVSTHSENFDSIRVFPGDSQK